MSKKNNLKKIIFIGIVSLTVSTSIFFLLIHKVSKEIPEDAVLRRLESEGNLKFNSQNQTGIISLTHIWVPWSDIAASLKLAVLISEDSIAKSEVINYRRVWNSLRVSEEKKSLIGKSSMITRKLVRTYFLRNEGSPFKRFIEELLISKRIEEILPKRIILEQYLNGVQWGDRIYGAEAASQFYFQKSAKDLHPGESAFLAAILSESRFTMNREDMKKIYKRQREILYNMFKLRFLTDEELKANLNNPVIINIETEQNKVISLERMN